MSTRIAILTSLLLASGALAHCQLAWPYPLHSPLNPATPEAIKDYSMTSPLISDGTYPCKGFINNPSSDMTSVATYSAGSTMNFTIAGTATHGGGSCQISMSYDEGSTWNVIFSQVGGCLIDGMTTDITIPSDAPSGEALFAWGWFNRQGNREMYHNCAPITIKNGGSGLNDNDYPTPFVANANVNECVTIENIDVVFPNPGKNVKYGGNYASTKPTTPAGFAGSNCVGPGASSSGSTSSSSVSATKNTTITPTSTQSTLVSASNGVGIANNASFSTSTTIAQPTGEYTLSLDSTTASLSQINNAADSSSAITSSQPATTSASSTGKTCKSTRKRSVLSTSGLRGRHQRLIRRPRTSSGRVAASKAEHISHEEKRENGRIAASKAEHITHEAKRASSGRVAASKAEHINHEAKRASGRVAASKAEHIAHQQKRGTGRVAAMKATHNLQVRNGVIEAVRS
ncbi:uncharacterized protein IL334_005541 [Kwoniella shivajii]|uniref:Lytic polysaccharide monooxygenase n=1 Tax=Kwoniella shivajii TaxID=564305 RepID=A0ABZ1D4Z1_9TREE|nr:hypothetical protein IL334_005541 [Kwoniella shivajii]